ncbi:MAG: DUF2807 domain-containing protein [Alistipes sp.]|nr:DUF2807 domain-containing protein [Alistipes sp.]
MKRIVLLLLSAAVCATSTLQAQQLQQTPQQPLAAQSDKPANSTDERLAAITRMPQSMWLGAFSRINISGAMKVMLVRIPENEGPKIVYDTKGSTTTKFKAEVDKKGTLNVIESVDAKRTSVTEVTIYYSNIESLRVATAKVTMEHPYNTNMFDLFVSGGATVNARIEAQDLMMEATGRSCVILEGAARYLNVKITTAQFDASALQSLSAEVDASHGAEVIVNISERLEVTTSTSAKVSYKGTPTILRCHSSLFGGEIVAIGK